MKTHPFSGGTVAIGRTPKLASTTLSSAVDYRGVHQLVPVQAPYLTIDTLSNGMHGYLRVDLEAAAAGLPLDASSACSALSPNSIYVRYQ